MMDGTAVQSIGGYAQAALKPEALKVRRDSTTYFNPVNGDTFVVDHDPHVGKIQHPRFTMSGLIEALRSIGPERSTYFLRHNNSCIVLGPDPSGELTHDAVEHVFPVPVFSEGWSLLANEYKREDFAPRVALRLKQLGWINQQQFAALSSMASRREVTDSIATKTDVVHRELPEGPYLQVTATPVVGWPQSAATTVQVEVSSSVVRMQVCPQESYRVMSLVWEEIARSIRDSVKEAGLALHSVLL